MLDCIYNLQLDSSKVTTPTTNIVVFGAFILSFLSLILTPSTAPASRTTRRYSTASSAAPPTRPTSTTPSTCSSATTTGGRTPTSKSTARWTMNASRQVLPLAKKLRSHHVLSKLTYEYRNITSPSAWRITARSSLRPRPPCSSCSRMSTTRYRSSQRENWWVRLTCGMCNPWG